MANVHDVANTFLYLDRLNEGEGLTNLKLQKLVYYAQGFYLAIFDAPLFDENIEAWTHGPVSPDLYNKYKGAGRELLNVDDDFDPSVLTDDEKGLIDEVYDVFGQFSAWKLRNMTHEEEPWITNEANAGIIPNEEMREYFKTRVN